MTFMIGDKVVYPSQGPCLIGAVVQKTIAGERTRFYPLSFLDKSGDAVLIPIDKLRALPIRHLLAKSEIPKLLGHLEISPLASKNWKQRAIDNAKLLASGSAFDLAEIVESLTELSEAKSLLPRDRQTLEKARRFLICEISEVMGQSRDAAEGEIDRALGSKRTLLKSSTVYAQAFPSRRRHIKYARPGFTAR
ncbi:MAG: CarD family transcriptional regulator [Candidatus Binatia bacterium]